MLMPEDVNKASIGEGEGSRCRLRQTTKPLPPRMNDEAAATSVRQQGHHWLRQTTVSPPTISEAELASDDQRITTPLPPNKRRSRHHLGQNNSVPSSYKWNHLRLLKPPKNNKRRQESVRIKRDIKTYGTKLNSPRSSTSPGNCSPRCHAKNTKPPPLPRTSHNLQ